MCGLDDLVLRSGRAPALKSSSTEEDAYQRKVLLWAVISGGRKQTYGIVRATAIAAPDRRVYFVDHAVVHVWEELPDGVYVIETANTALRALCSNGTWLITGKT